MYVLALVVFVAVGVDALRERVQVVDDAWLDAMVAIDWRPLTLSAEFFDIVGSGLVLWPVRVLVAVWLARNRRWVKFTTFLVAVVSSDLAIGLFKNLYERGRPPNALVDTTGFSFPSGHAVATAVTAVLIVIVVFPPGPHRRIWEIRAGLFAFAMALSRTYLRAHWLSDVVAGTLLGAATAVGVAAALHEWQLRRRRALANGPP